MLARRIIALSPDKAFAKQLAIALRAAGGTVDAHLTLDELGTGELHAALVVIHQDGAMAGAAAALIPRLVGDTRVIAILPRPDLAAVVDLMQGADRIAGVMVAEEPRHHAALGDDDPGARRRYLRPRGAHPVGHADPQLPGRRLPGEGAVHLADLGVLRGDERAARRACSSTCCPRSWRG